MMTREEAMMKNGSQRHEKIKTPFAKMIVGGKREKPCFSILYFDPADKDFHIGYSSYYLDYVFNWLSENFEIVEDGNFTISALRPVSREQVEKAWTAEWTVDEFGHKCSKCGEYLPDGEDVRKPQFCPECGRAMTDEAVEMVMEKINNMEEMTNEH